MEYNFPYIATLAATGEPIILTPDERARHVYIVGKSGSGKSTMLRNLAALDILGGEGVFFIDPHGDHAAELADSIPKHRTHEVCYLNVADTDYPVGFNPLFGVPPERRALAASGIVSAFKSQFSDSWGPRLEHFLYNGIAALLDQDRTSLIDLPVLFTNDTFRERVIRRLTDPVTRRFWTQEYPSYDKKYRTEAAGPILNKVGQLVASPNVRAIIGQERPRFDLRLAMDKSQIVIANLAKGVIGEQGASLLGSLLISHLQLLALSRSEQPPETRVPFHVHIDELQSFGTDTIATLLSEARKFGVHLCLANQYTDQLSARVRAAIFGNAGSLVVYRVSGADAELLAPEFHPLPANALAENSPFVAWMRRSVHGHRRINAEPPIAMRTGRINIVIEQSRRHYGQRAFRLRL